MEKTTQQIKEEIRKIDERLAQLDREEAEIDRNLKLAIDDTSQKIEELRGAVSG